MLWSSWYICTAQKNQGHHALEVYEVRWVARDLSSLNQPPDWCTFIHHKPVTYSLFTLGNSVPQHVQSWKKRLLWCHFSDHYQCKYALSDIPNCSGKQITVNYNETRSIWKMLGPFATASRRTPPVLHCHSPGVAIVSHAACASMSTTTTTRNKRGPLWPHRMGPITPKGTWPI